MELISSLDGHSRLQIPVVIQNKTGHEAKIKCIIGTGCHTTMLDARLASQYGEKLEDTYIVNLGNKRYKTQAHKLDKLFLRSLKLNNVFVLAAHFDVASELYSANSFIDSKSLCPASISQAPRLPLRCLGIHSLYPQFYSSLCTGLSGLPAVAKPPCVTCLPCLPCLTAGRGSCSFDSHTITLSI